MVFNQNFVPGWNAIYSNLIMKISQVIITSNQFASPFSQMLQNMETGQYVEDIHINPSAAFLQDTIANTHIFHDFHDDLAVAVYEVGVDLCFGSSYKEFVVRTSFSMLQNVNELVSALTANIRVTLEYWRNELTKQMLYNAYQYGMLSSVLISDPRNGEQQSGQFAVALNVLLDDFRTEINTRNVIYNNQVGITTAEMRKTIAKEFPYVIIFNEFVRNAEFLNALNLGLMQLQGGGRWQSGNANDDWQNRLIKLNLEDFPTSIPPLNRSAVMGNDIPATGVNFFEMPKDASGNDLFSGTPTGGDTICAFVIEPAALKLFTQLSIMTAWLNPATLSHTNREIYRGIMQLGAFNKICAVTCNDGQDI